MAKVRFSTPKPTHENSGKDSVDPASRSGANRPEYIDDGFGTYHDNQ